MNALEQIWRQDAIERMADNDRVITEQRERIDVLEFHLGKLRELLWLGYCNTNGVLPMEFVKDMPTGKPVKSVKKKAVPA